MLSAHTSLFYTMFSLVLVLKTHCEGKAHSLSFYIYRPPHDDVIKWKLFPRYWPFVRGIHRSPVNSPHKGQWRGALVFSLISVWINGWDNKCEAGDLRRHHAHYDVTVMSSLYTTDKNMEYLDSTMETFVLDILICWKWLGTNHK